MPSSLLQVVNSLFQTYYNKLGTSSANTTCWQLVNRFVTTCLQTCYKLCVFTRVADHPTGTSARRNGVGLPRTTFNRRTRLDLNMHPYHMHIRHQLLSRDCARRMQFARWLVDRCRWNEGFLRSFVVGDETVLPWTAKLIPTTLRSMLLQDNHPRLISMSTVVNKNWQSGSDFVATTR
jgi:hypothetical protein